MQQTLSEILAKTPFIRFTIPLLLGIFCGEYGLCLSFSALWLTVVFGFVYLFLSFYKQFISYSNRWVWGILSFLFLFFGGVSLWQQQKRASELPLSQPILLNAVVIEHPVQKPKTIQLRLRVDGYRQDDSWTKANENIVVYLQTDDKLIPQAGQRLLLSATLQPIKPPMNPEEFDYSSYMKRRGYYATTFAKEKSFSIIGENELPFYRSVPLKMQQGLLNTFKGVGIEGQELGVLMALTIGDKQLLDDEVKEAYSSAGVIHILAVSGLHVGLLYILLTYILFFLRGKRYKLVLKAVLILFCIWLYAAMAGFSPSVTRAAIMFSFVLLAQLSGRQSSTLNAVFASAFFICLFKPQSLFEVGFQLSYLAVLGILAFYSRLSKLLAIKNIMLRGIWSICCVSFAAQLTVLPLSVFYFHQMPVYFLLANVMVLPLVTIAVYLIILLLLLSFIPLLSTFIGYLLGVCIWMVTYVATAVQQLPYAVWNDIYLSPMQLVFCLAALISFMLFIVFRKRYSLWLSISCVMLVLSLGMAHYLKTSKQNQLVVFSVNNASFVTFTQGHDAICVKDDKGINTPFEYNTSGYFIKQRIKQEDIQSFIYNQLDSISFSDSLRYHNGFLWFCGHSIKILNRSNEVVSTKTPLPIDFLIVTRECLQQPSEVLENYHPGLVVLDTSIGRRKEREWLTFMINEGISYHNVKEKGALVLSFN